MHVGVSSVQISNSLIESSILINLENMEEQLNSPNASRRYSSAYVSNDSNTSISLELDSNLDSASGATNILPSFINDLSTVFSGMPPASKIDGFDHSIHYLLTLANSQNLRMMLLLMPSNHPYKHLFKVISMMVRPTWRQT